MSWFGYRKLCYYIDQLGPGCLQGTHYILLYLIAIYYYLKAKRAISDYDMKGGERGHKMCDASWIGPLKSILIL